MNIRGWLLSSFAVVVCACSSTGVNRTDKLMSNLDDLATTSATARTNIERASTSLNALLENAADPRATYDKYRDDVSAVASSKSSLESIGGSVRAATDAHFVAWEQDANAMSNPDMRNAAMKRREEARSNMNALDPALTAMKTEFNTYVADLRDIEKLLGTDLSPGGISAASSIIKKATKEGDSVTKALVKLESTVMDIRSSLGVPTPPVETK